MINIFQMYEMGFSVGIDEYSIDNSINLLREIKK